MSIEICNESGVAVDETAIVSVARFALDAMRVNPLAELSVLLVELDVMAELHQRWMELPGPTDVMSFRWTSWTPTRRPDSLDDPESILGDVVLCPAFAKDQARSAGHSLADELHLLTVHACCTCSATTTPSRTRSARCSPCRTSFCSVGGPTARRRRAQASARSTPTCWGP